MLFLLNGMPLSLTLPPLFYLKSENHFLSSCKIIDGNYNIII